MKGQTMGSKLDTIYFKSNKFVEAVYEHGWACTKLSEAVGRNRQYLRQAMSNRRINYETLLDMCKILGVDPDQFTGREDYIPIQLSNDPIKLDTEGTVVLFQAIVTRAKEDYILAYRDLLSGKHKIRDGHMSLMVSTIEWELQSEWFKNHLIGAITTNTNAVEKMLMAWRREARVLYDNQRSKRMAQSSN